MSNFHGLPDGRTQAAHSPGDHLCALALPATYFGVWGAVGRFAVHLLFANIYGLIDRNFAAGAILSKLHQSGIDGDTREPGVKARPAIELSYVNEGTQERVLKCVFGIFAISGNAKGSAK